MSAQVHDEARHNCLESAREFGLTMSCEDEYECPCPTHCDFYQRAIETLAERQRRQDTWTVCRHDYVRHDGSVWRCILCQERFAVNPRRKRNPTRKDRRERAGEER